MKKTFIYLFSILMMATVVGCNPKNTPSEPSGTDTTNVDTGKTNFGPVVEATFPMKHIIEEFTGEDCGYCPYGMDCVSEFMGNDQNWILLMHHAGYDDDHFTIAGSKKISKKLGVNGAPTISVDRNKNIYNKSLTFHPGYLPNVNKSKIATETYVSTVIQNNYDAASRQLTVTVSGQIGKAVDSIELMLTVVVKESGMIDYQADYYNTYEGWQEFRHVSAARVFLTDPFGDKIQPTQDKDGRLLYTAEYTTTLNDAWVADNCAVVAFVSEGLKPIVQVEEQPVVAGTQGGRDIEHEGITAVPVSENYPEPDNGNGPFDYYTDADNIAFNVSYARYTPYSNYGFNFWQMMAYNENITINCENTQCVPFAYIYIFTETTQTAIPTGEYPINGTMQPGTVWAGYRDDSKYEVDGSVLYFTSKTYFEQNYLVPAAKWLIASGTLTVRENGWTLTGTTRGGKTVSMSGGAIQNGGRAQAPARMIQNRPMGFEGEFKRLSFVK